jgi:hypothetical protein
MTDTVAPPHIRFALNQFWGGHAVATILSEAHLQFITEDDLQQAIKNHLDAAQVFPEREVRLSDGHSRIDMIAGRTGIEVKLEGSWANVIRQLTRYAKCPEIESLVLVTTRAKHHKLPDQLCGKPLNLVSLIGAGL